MNDEEVFDLMRREADNAPLGDRDDLRRGRARLRRRRVITGGGGVAGVALVAALVGGYLPAPGEGADPTPAISSDMSHDEVEELADRTGRAVTKAMMEHTPIEEFGVDHARHGYFGGTLVSAGGPVDELTDVYWMQEWRENAGTGFLQVTVSRQLDNDPELPQRWYDSCAERFGPWASVGAWPDEYDDCDHRTVDGQPLLVGVERRADAHWILVKYLRSDGVVVELGFDSPLLKSDAPVLEPSLTTDQLVDVVTDPRVRMYLDEPIDNR